MWKRKKKEKEEPKDTYVLCYVDGTGGHGFAFFTNKPLSEQWGDDWDDAPYMYNAGYPYNEDPEQIRVLAFMGIYIEVNRDETLGVEAINDGQAPWIRFHGSTDTVMAGTTIEDFEKLIRNSGGRVYRDTQDEKTYKKKKSILTGSKPSDKAA